MLSFSFFPPSKPEALMAKLLCIFAATAAAPVWAYVVNPRLSHNLCFGRNRAAPALLLSSHLHNVGPDAASSEVGSEVRAEPNFLLLRAEGVSAIAAGRPASGTAACKYAEGTRGARLWTLRAQYKALMEQDRARLRLERERKELEAELEYLGALPVVVPCVLPMNFVPHSMQD